VLIEVIFEKVAVVSGYVAVDIDVVERFCECYPP